MTSNTKEQELKKEKELKGNLSVHTENLFPIIKKWLYSDRDVFLRELVSNAHDATKKLERLSMTGEALENYDGGKLDIRISQKDNTISFSDNGIGMSADELQTYINQIAFSGAEDFMKKYKSEDEKNALIGHFGLGFFSAFMVADKVEIITKSYKAEEPAMHWECEGSTEFTMKPSQRPQGIGSSIVLHLAKDSKDLLDESYIKKLVQRYADFLPIDIFVNDKKANSQDPIWQKDPKQLDDKEYKQFYGKIFSGEEDPLFYVHIRVDHPFTLRGVLYFPKVNLNFDPMSSGRILLYSNNVFVSDNIVDIIPRHLNMLRGVLDSPDIPLNVSRSSLQSNQSVRKLSSHIVKKISDKLVELFKEQRENFETYWKDIHAFIKLAVINDNDFYDKINSILLFGLSQDGKQKMVTLEEYAASNSLLKDKVLYASDEREQYNDIKNLEALGVQVIILSSPIDQHFIQAIEHRRSPLRFLRVDSAPADELLGGQEAADNENKTVSLDEESDKQFEEAFKKAVAAEDLTFTWKVFAKEKQPSLAAQLVQNEQMRRFKEMSLFMKPEAHASSEQALPIGSSLVINRDNRLVKKIRGLLDKKDRLAECTLIFKTIFNMALLRQGMLKGHALEEFIKHSSGSIEKDLLSDKTVASKSHGRHEKPKAKNASSGIDAPKKQKAPKETSAKSPSKTTKTQ